jgi:hypothetical protein
MNKYAPILLPMLFAVTIQGASSIENQNDAHESLLSKRVPMVALLANPGNFNNKQVCVDGILHSVYEDDTLYLNREMADALIKTNGLGLHYNETKLKLFPLDGPVDKKVGRDYFHNKLCAVLGTFKARSNTLENITAVWEDSGAKKH